MTISEIAKLAGVSTATVSRYLNDGYVSEEKKKKIAQVIKETGYIPSSAAQNMKGQKTKTIGVIVPRINSEAIAQMVNGITKRVNETKYQIILVNTDNQPEKEIESLKYFEFNQVDGVILSATKITEEHREILSHFNKPLVIISQNVEGYFCVYNDDEGAAYQATKHLIEQDCSKIVYLGVLEDDIAAGYLRHKGFKKALKENNLESVAERIVDFSALSGYEAVQDLLEKDNNVDFDGIFCASDSIAVGAINRLHFSGKEVPKDVKIISVGDTILSKAYIPSISSVHLYYEELGDQAASLMIDILEGKKIPVRQVQLGNELCVRESTTQLTTNNL